MRKLFVCALSGTLLAAVACMSLRASAGETGDDVLKRVEALEKEVKGLKRELAEGKRTLWSMDGGNLRVKIGGQYRIMGSASNFDWHAGSVSDDEDGRTFFNQRFRTWFDVETSENVSAHLQIEIGHIIWGEDYEFTKNYAVGGDQTGSELRRGYIVYKRDDLGIFRVGIQDWSDAFGGVLASGDWDFNVGGLAYSHKLEELWNTEIKVGAFMLWEGDTATAADDTTLFTLDLAWPLGEKTKVGLSVYYLNDNGDYSYGTFGGPAVGYEGADDIWIGVHGQTEIDKLTLGGFFIYNDGSVESPNWDHSGFALGVKLGYDLGFGKVGLQTLYASGEKDPTDDDSSEFRTIAQSERDNFGAQGYWSFLGLTSPRGSSDVQDLGVGLQNRGLGLVTVQGNFEAPITEKLTGYLAVGWLSAAEDNPANGEKDMGVELLAELKLDLGGGLTLEFGGAVLFTGDFYETPGAGDPDDLYELFCRLQLEF